MSDDYEVSAEREGAEFESPVYHEAVAKALKRKLGDTALPRVATKKDSPFVGLSVRSGSAKDAREELGLYLKEYQKRRVPVLAQTLSNVTAAVQAEVTSLRADLKVARADSGSAVSRLRDLRLQFSVSSSRFIRSLAQTTRPCSNGCRLSRFATRAHNASVDYSKLLVGGMRSHAKRPRTPASVVRFVSQFVKEYGTWELDSYVLS